MTANNQEEMETFQRLSDQYQPEIEGPLVQEKRPMSVLMQEYAQADPAYIAKTASLAATHSAYRSIKGDGQCGWRGAVFGYFETLLAVGDIQIVVQEVTRIRSFDDTMRMAGIDYDMVVDLLDYTWELFDKIRSAVESQSKDDSMLMETFNDEGQSNSIIYHFKLMTSAFMALRPDNYEPFLEMPLAEYRALRIDPTNQEIDQIGLQALVDGVISPAGVALEVSYLDRSEGDEVTPHQFAENSAGWPAVRLLYRPGHYDMIYKQDQAIRVMPVRIPHQVMLPTDMGQSYPEGYSYMNPSSMNYNPVITSTPQQHQRPQSHQYNCPSSNETQFHGFESYSQGYSQYDMQSTQFQEPAGYNSLPPPSLLSASLPVTVTVSDTPSSPTVVQSLPSPPGPRFRMSHAQHEFSKRRQQSIPFEAQSMRETIEEPNNILNVNFQPDIWSPEAHYKST